MEQEDAGDVPSLQSQSQPQPQRGTLLRRAHEFIPSGCGRVFVITTRDVWLLHGNTLCQAGTNATTIYLTFGIHNAASMSVYSGAGHTAECGDFSYTSR